MNIPLTRRQFVKGAAGTFAALGTVALPVESMAGAHCENCGAVSSRNLASAFLPFVAAPLLYCPNCGIGLRTLSHDIECPRYAWCLAEGKAACTGAETQSSPCFLVPFPNAKLLMGTRHPRNNLIALKF